MNSYNDTIFVAGDRVAMWHEAGHAVVAMHYGRKVFSYGIAPIPHALVNSLLLSTHQKGVLLAAGAAMTEAVYGVEWGGEASDYPMARTLGDLDVFKAEARKLVRELLPQAQYLVNQRLGEDTTGIEDNLIGLPKIDESTPHYHEVVKAAKKARMPKALNRLMLGFARLQLTKPRFAALLARIAP